MKLIIAGGRDLTVTNCFISELLNHFRLQPTEIVSGKALGIDKCGDSWSIIVLKKESTPFRAKWDQFGKAAGPIRNKQMANYLDPNEDAVLLIWDGISSGTGAGIVPQFNLINEGIEKE